MSREHSVKVPRLYKVATNILKSYNRGEGSVRNLVLAQKKHPNIKALMALVLNAVQHQTAIQSGFASCELLQKESPLDADLALILATELLLGKGQLPGQSKPEHTIRSYEQQLRSSVSLTGRSNRFTLPRYVRLNRLKAPVPERVIEQLKKAHGFHEVFYDESNTSYARFLSLVEGLEAGQFLRDLHIPDLLVFAAGTEFHNSKLYHDGVLLLQDKASCFPVECLQLAPGSIALDACAAPGMKTSQLVAAIFRNEDANGHVTAIERDDRRCETLKNMLHKAGAIINKDKIHVQNSDFLRIDPEEHKDIEYIVLDPSCSGSGMVRREGHLELSQARLQKLSSLQTRLLEHAMKFPMVKKISYSTCSVAEEENEQVVEAALASSIGSNFEVVHSLPSWERRGQGNYPFASNCIRAEALKDACNGFFVAIFQRNSKKEEKEADKDLHKSKKKKKKRKSESDFDELSQKSKKKKKNPE